VERRILFNHVHEKYGDNLQKMKEMYMRKYGAEEQGNQQQSSETPMSSKTADTNGDNGSETSDDEESSEPSDDEESSEPSDDEESSEPSDDEESSEPSDDDDDSETSDDDVKGIFTHPGTNLAQAERIKFAFMNYRVNSCSRAIKSVLKQLVTVSLIGNDWECIKFSRSNK
jgi:hypothetical protein